MTDKELLELAAKAANDKNIRIDSHGYFREIGEHEDGTLCMVNWNPLTDDGDALRLAVTLRINLDFLCENVFATHECGIDAIQSYNEGPCSATRRAIVRAAAEVGKGMLTHDELVAMFSGRFLEGK